MIPFTERKPVKAYLPHKVRPMEENMSIISKISDTGRGLVSHLVEWRREISGRNGTDDARRASANRLRLQLGSIGPWLGVYSSCEMSTPYRTHPHRERLVSDDKPRF